MKNLTNMETEVLISHLRHTQTEMGGRTVDAVRNDNFSYADLDDLLANLPGEKMSPTTVRGVVGSLAKKGMVYNEGHYLVLADRGIDYLEQLEAAGTAVNLS